MFDMVREDSRFRLVAVTVLAAIATVGIWGSVNALRGDSLQLLDLPEVPKASAETQLGRFNPQALYEQRAAGVVTIFSLLPDPGARTTHREVSGSGFVVDANGHILTNSHVVRVDGVTADYVFVDFMSGDRIEAAVVGVDAFSDLAVLRVDPDAVELHPVPLGDSDRVAVGEPVAAIGSPFGNEGSLSIGIISAVDRSVPAVVSNYDIPGVIQTDAAINKGNSGGPLFNAAGDVIGVNTQIRSESGASEGVGFAIPASVARRTLEEIVAKGRVSYAYFGIDTVSVNPQMAAELGLGSARGAMVSWLLGGGAAEQAGLRTYGKAANFQGHDVPLGDVIVEVAGEPVHSSEDMTRIVHRLTAGAPVPVVLWRGDKRMSVEVVPGERV